MYSTCPKVIKYDSFYLSLDINDPFWGEDFKKVLVQLFIWEILFLIEKLGTFIKTQLISNTRLISFITSASLLIKAKRVKVSHYFDILHFHLDFMNNLSSSAKKESLASSNPWAWILALCSWKCSLIIFNNALCFSLHKSSVLSLQLWSNAWMCFTSINGFCYI